MDVFFYLELLGILAILLLSMVYVIRFRHPIVDIGYSRYKYETIDFIIIAVFVVVNAALLFYYLGEHHTKGSWFGDFSGKNISVNFTQPTTVKQLSFWGCVANGVVDFSYIDEHGRTAKFATINNQHVNSVKCDWHNLPTNTTIKLRSVIVEVIKPLVTINRLVVTDFNDISLREYNSQAMIDPKLDNMEEIFFQSESILPNIAYDATFFDENAYVLPAFHYLYQHSFDVNLAHPQMGPLLIGQGIKIFGMNPFGWRFMVGLSGLLLVVLIYIFATDLFFTRRAGILAALLLTFEFMHFSISRVAIIEPLVTLFLVSEYFCLWQYLKRRKLYFAGGWLLLAAICFALALSIKWSALFSLLAVVLLVLVAEFREYKIGSGYKLFETLTSIICIWVIVPFSIYILSYVPYLLMVKQSFFPTVLILQRIMLLTHTKWAVFLDIPNVPWWSWPLDLHPMSIFFWFNKENLLSNSIVLMANPAISWFGIIAIFILIYKCSTNFRQNIWFIIVVFGAQYLPYALVTRIQYMYYFYSALPLLILAVAGLLDEFFTKRDPILTLLVYVYLGIVVLLFVAFYPALSGITISRVYVFKYLLWFQGWFF